MPELNRNNLNEGHVDTARIPAHLLFPSGRKRYVEDLEDFISLRPLRNGEITFWKNRDGVAVH